MAYGDVRDEWRLNDIEGKISRVENRLYQIDSLRSDMDRLEHSYRQACSAIDGLRAEIQVLREDNIVLHEIIDSPS